MDYTISINKNWLLRNSITANEASRILSQRTKLSVKVRARAGIQTLGDMSTYDVDDYEVAQQIRDAWEQWTDEL